MTRGGSGRPVPIEALEAVAHAYVHSDNRLTRSGMARELGITKDVLHARLQQIRHRTGIGSNIDACTELLIHPAKYEKQPRMQITPEAVARRAAMRRSGMTYTEIARAEGVSRSAIDQHFRRHEP